MRVVLGLAVVAGLTGLAAAADAGYTVNSRYSEFKHDRFDNQFPAVDDVFSTTALGNFVVPGGGSAPPNHVSNVTASGATYEAHTRGQTNVGPPAGSGRYGYFQSSRFELLFTVTGTASFTLTGSLRHWLEGSPVTLKLEALTPGGSPTLTAIATGNFNNNFAPDAVNWGGTLLAGQYRLSIVEGGQMASPGPLPSFGTDSSFTFAIPTPGTAGVLLTLTLPALRRRRL